MSKHSNPDVQVAVEIVVGKPSMWEQIGESRSNAVGVRKRQEDVRLGEDTRG